MLKFRLIIVLNLVLCPFIDAGENYNFNGLVYFFSYPLRKNWYQAMRYCNSHNMSLLAIETREEDDFIVNIMRNTPAYFTDSSNFWTSGNDVGDNGKYYWASTGNRTEYLNWAPGEPSATPVEDCIELRGMAGFRWNNARCDRLKYFICEPKKCRTYLAYGCCGM